MSSIILLLLVIDTIILTIADYKDCGFYFSQYNVTYDLSPLTLTNDYYKVTSDGYDFLFNLCNDTILSAPYIGPCHSDSRSVFTSLPSSDQITRFSNTTSMAFQATSNGNGGCWRMAGSFTESDKYNTSNLITYQLIDESAPSDGIIVHYNYGDSGCGKNRQFDIKFICDPLLNIIGDNEMVKEMEPSSCEYEMEILSVYGCPLECFRDENNTLCSGNGLCSYDHPKKVAECKCYSGFAASNCNETVPILIDPIWYKNNITFNNESNYTFEFTTSAGITVQYDLQFFIDGYINDSNNLNKFYKLNDASSPPHDYYLSLFNKQQQDPTKCNNYNGAYDYGYIYQVNPNINNSFCPSLGRNISLIELYDETLPTKGIHIEYTEGEGGGCSGFKSRKTDVYLICPDTDRAERHDNLNDLYSTKYFFSEPSVKCEYEIEIYTVAACPVQCITKDIDENAISQCSGNGQCGYDRTLQLIRCFCDSNMIIDEPKDIFCKHPNITYSYHTDAPTSDPTVEPTQHPTFALKDTLQCGDYYIGKTLYQYDSDNFTFIVTNPAGISAKFDLCGSTFDTRLYIFDGNGTQIYFNDDNPECHLTSLIEDAVLYPNIEYKIKIDGHAGQYGLYHINISCDDYTLSPTQIPSKSPTPSPTHSYSLYGVYTHFDYDSDVTFQVHLSIDELCEFIKFEFITPGCSNLWFGFGIGGNYYEGESSEESDVDESNKMNGYAIIVLSGDTPNEYKQIYESTLSAGDYPQPQTQQNLRNCTIEIRDCLQYIICFRDFMTSDSDNDYYQFEKGINDIIWAYGDKSDIDFIPQKHLHKNAEDSKIYLEDIAEYTCYTDIEPKETGSTISKSDDDNNEWQIVAIIFIILFVITLLLLLYIWYKNKDKKPGFTANRVGSYDNDGNDENELATMNITTSH